jgi:hypothetical protein
VVLSVSRLSGRREVVVARAMTRIAALCQTKAG